MNKHFLKFMNKEVNSCRADVLIGREQSGITEYITITPYEQYEPLYSFWYNPKKKGSGDKGPKHTGGKPAYIKVYIEKLINSGKSYDLIGASITLSMYLKWDTGYLEVYRGKKRRYMTSDDIVKALGVGRATGFRILKRMKTAGLINHDKTGYKLTGGYFVKGVVSSED